MNDFDLIDLPGELCSDEEIAFLTGRCCPCCLSPILDDLPDLTELGWTSPEGQYCPVCGWQSVPEGVA